MAGLNLNYVGLIRPEEMAEEVARIAGMIREGFTSGELRNGGGGWWDADGVSADADDEDGDEGTFDETD